MLTNLLGDIGRSLYSGETRSYNMKLHLGCGTNLLPGWVNVDLGGPIEVVKWDLRQPLPVASESVDYIFNEHFIEHITQEEGLKLLQECNRVLKREGVLRISTPNVKKLVDEYLNGRTTEWVDVNWVPRTPCRLLNEGMRSWGHQFLYDTAEFETSLIDAGFSIITHVPWRESRHPALRGLECRPYHGEIIVEVEK